jgi:hypothetical protein
MSSILIFGRRTHNSSSISIRKLLFNTLAINLHPTNSIPVNKYANLQTRLLSSSSTASIDTILKKKITPLSSSINKTLNPISIANANNEILSEHENSNRNTANTYSVNEIAEIFIERMTKVEASYFIRMIKIMNEKDHDYILIYSTMNSKTKKENRWMGQWVWSMIQKDLSSNLHPNSIDIISDIDNTKYKMDLHDNLNYNDVHKNLKETLFEIEKFDNFLVELGEGNSALQKNQRNSRPISNNSFYLPRQMKSKKDTYKITGGGDCSVKDTNAVDLATHICNTVSLRVASDVTETIKKILKEDIKGDQLVKELRRSFDIHSRSLYSLLEYLSIRVHKFTEIFISSGEKSRLELIESLASELKQCLTVGKWSVAYTKSKITHMNSIQLTKKQLKEKQKQDELLKLNLEAEGRKIKQVELDSEGNEIVRYDGNSTELMSDLLNTPQLHASYIQNEKTTKHVRKFGSKHTHFMVIKCISQESRYDNKYSEYNSSYIDDNNIYNNNDVFENSNNNNNNIVQDEDRSKFKIFIDNIHEDASVQDVVNSFRNCGKISKIWYFQSTSKVDITNKYTNLSDKSDANILSPGTVVNIDDDFNIINVNNDINNLDNKIDDDDDDDNNNNTVDNNNILDDIENNIINLIPPVTKVDEARNPLATFSAIKTRKPRSTKAETIKKKKVSELEKKIFKKSLSSIKVQRSRKSDGFAFIEVSDENCLNNVTCDELRIFGLNILSKNCKIVESKKIKTIYIELCSSMDSETVTNLLSSILGYGLEFYVVNNRFTRVDAKPVFIHLECDNHDNAWKIFQHLKQANMNGLPLKPSWVKCNWYRTVGSKAREMNLDKKMLSLQDVDGDNNSMKNTDSSY